MLLFNELKSNYRLILNHVHYLKSLAQQYTKFINNQIFVNQNHSQMSQSQKSSQIKRTNKIIQIHQSEELAAQTPTIKSSKTQLEVDYQKLYEEEKKKSLRLQNQLELQKIRTRKLMSHKMKGKLCPKCFNETSDHKPNAHGSNNINKEDMRDFSDKIGQKLKKNNDKSLNLSTHSRKKQYEQITILDSLNLQSHSKISFSKKHLQQVNTNMFPMIENFTVFGVSEENIQSNMGQSVSELLDGDLLQYLHEPSDVDKQAGRLVFPSGVALKKMVGQRAKDKAIQMMSFSYANIKSFILRFKRQQNIDEQEYQKNQFLSHINPSKSLFCLCIGIYDYTTVNTGMQKRKNKDPASLKHFEEEQQPPQQLMQQKFVSMTDNGKQNSSTEIKSNEIDNTQIYISQRVFCISSYYPFFTFYEQILRSLLNIIKMQRLMIYKHNNQNLATTDSKFQLSRIKELFISSMKDLNLKQVNFNRSYEFKLVNQQKITLLTDWNLAKTFFIEEWIFAILHMFNVDTFIDVFTLMMLEDRIVFICNNSHILTYTIYLFTNILAKPFLYAFEVVSIIPEEDFLGAPFPVVYGLLRKRKNVEESNIFRDYKNTYIFLSPEKVDITYTESKKHLLKCRPERLKIALTQLFKDLKKYRGTNQKIAKYELENTDYALTSNIEQRKIAIQIIVKINEHMLQQIVNKMPNSYEIKNLKNSINIANLDDKDEHSALMEKIKSIVKRNVKDPFVQKMLDTQMVSNMVCK